ncbi:hypothetical protein QW131_29105 [Roseibium salinum]|nr:hypothetical protein [Roseibium salinum]
MRASADPNLNEYIIEPIVADIREAIDDVRASGVRIDSVYAQMDGNLLALVGPGNKQERELRTRLNEMLNAFF